MVESRLGEDIDKIVEREGGSTDTELSAALARNGVLPMFGFPTRVRNLWNAPIRNVTAMRNEVVSDRSLDMAISSFTPGAQVVKDGFAHKVAGFAAYVPRGNTVETVTHSARPTP